MLRVAAKYDIEIMTDPDDTPDPWELARDPDRNRGFLTKRDRELLSGRVDLQSDADRDLRYRIRSRIENGLLDILLLENYPSEELEKVIQSEPAFFRYLRRYLCIVSYRISKILWEMPEWRSEYVDSNIDDFEVVLASAIERVEAAEGDVVEVDVEVNVDRSAFDERQLVNKIVAGNATNSEFWTYVERGDVEELHSELEAINRDIELVDGDTVSRDILVEFIQGNVAISTDYP